MKKLVTLIFLLISISSFSQGWQSQDTLRLKHFNTWVLSPYLARPYQYTDAGTIGSYSPPNFGFGFNIEKHLSHYFSLQLGWFSTSMNTNIAPLKYKTDFTQKDIKLCFHITNGSILRTWRSTQL